jgi:hypothetical protein
MKKKLKRRLRKLIARELKALGAPEGEWYFDPKLQRAFAGLRGQLASHGKRLDILETPNLVSLRKRRV